MCKTAVTYLQTHLIHRKCNAIIDRLVIPKRKSSTIYVRDPKIWMCHASLDRIVELYNKLPANVKAMKIWPFKRYLKKNTVKTS